MYSEGWIHILSKQFASGFPLASFFTTKFCNVLKRFFASRGYLCWSFFLILNRIAAAVLTHDIQETRDILPILCYTQIYKLYIPPWAVQCGRVSEIENL